MQLFRGRLVSKAHRLLCHSTLGLRVIKKKKMFRLWIEVWDVEHGLRLKIWSRFLGLRISRTVEGLDLTAGFREWGLEQLQGSEQGS